MKHSIIESWKRIVDKKDVVIIGNVYGDSRWPDGTMIRTSALLPMSMQAHTPKEGYTINTLNSTYLLGKPFAKESK
jgi:hypothetical protein